MIAALSSLTLPTFSWAGYEARVSSISRIEMDLERYTATLYGRCSLWQDDAQVSSFGVVTLRGILEGEIGEIPVEVSGLELSPVSDGYEVQFSVSLAALDLWAGISGD